MTSHGFVSRSRMSMAISTRIKWMTLTGILAILLAFVLIRPEWLARLVAVSIFSCVFNLVLFFYGCHPKSEFLYGKGKIARIGSERAKRNARRVLRGILVAFACFFCWNVTGPVLDDCAQFFRHGRSYLRDVNGIVRENDFILGMFFLNQDLVVSKNAEMPGVRYSAVFVPQLARVGHRYSFVIAPNSKFILAWTVANK